eukprot:4494978-Ditylum_brightwellii.AAC.1
MLAKGEIAFLNEGIAFKAIPQPRLLVKDHKEREENGDYPTCLVIPATNFKATFSKIGVGSERKAGGIGAEKRQ